MNQNLGASSEVVGVVIKLRRRYLLKVINERNKPISRVYILCDAIYPFSSLEKKIQLG